jgi:hypothetical protein
MKVWHKPQLIILAKDTSEEKVLQICKGASGIEIQAHGNAGACNSSLPNCIGCNNLVSS